MNGMETWKGTNAIGVQHQGSNWQRHMFHITIYSKKSKHQDQRLRNFFVAIDRSHRKYNYIMTTKDRSPEARKFMASASPQNAYEYARDVIDGRFPEGEKTIAKSAGYSYVYARDVLKGRFREGEKAIAADQAHASMYARILRSFDISSFPSSFK